MDAGELSVPGGARSLRMMIKRSCFLCSALKGCLLRGGHEGIQVSKGEQQSREGLTRSVKVYGDCSLQIMFSCDLQAFYQKVLVQNQSTVESSESCRVLRVLQSTASHQSPQSPAESSESCRVLRVL